MQSTARSRRRVAPPALVLLATLFVLPACSSPEDVAGDARKAVLAAVESHDWSAAAKALTVFRRVRLETARTVTELAGLMVRAGEGLEAIWILEDALARFPTSDSLRVELARAALSLGQPGRAVMALGAVSQDSPSLAEALSLRALAWLELGNASESRTALAAPRSALAGKPNATLEGQLELIQLGLVALEGEGDVGLAELRARVDSDPGNPSAWSVLVRELRREGRAEEALTLLEAAVAAEPDRIDLNPPLVATHMALDDRSAAEQVIRARITSHPTPGAHSALARLRGGWGDLGSVLARYTIATDNFPRSAMLRSARTEVLLDIGRGSEAEIELARFNKLSKSGPRAEFLQARVELAKDKPDHALRRLVEVVERIDSPSNHYWLGRALEDTEDPAEAESRYLLALQGDPENMFAAVRAAVLARQRGDWRAVIRTARAGVAAGPHEPLGWAVLADGLAQLSEWNDAEPIARQRLERFPDHVSSHVRLAEALRALRRLDEAQAVLDDAGKVGLPKKALVAGRRRVEREKETAAAAAGEVDAVTAQAPELVAERVLLLGAQGKIAEGLDLSERVLRGEGRDRELSDVQEARLMAVKAELLFAMRRNQAALSALSLALETNPDDLRPLLRRATYHGAVRKMDMLQRDCERFLDKRPDDPRLHRIQGMVFAAAGREDEALAAYRRAVALDEQDWASANNLAMVLVDRNELDEALVAASLAATLAPENPWVLDTMGYVALRAGQAERAVEALEKALGIAPEFAEAELHLAEAYGAAGRTSDGRRVLAKLKKRAGANPQVLARISKVQAGLP